MNKLPFDSVKIDNFRGIRGLSLRDFRSINLFIGNNNSGKTSILEVISLLTSPDDASEWERVVQRRDYGGLDESRLLSLRWCFNKDLFSNTSPTDNQALSCDFEMDGAYPLRAMSASYSENTVALGSLFARADYANFFLKYQVSNYAQKNGRYTDLNSLVRVAEVKHKLIWDKKRADNKRYPPSARHDINELGIITERSSFEAAGGPVHQSKSGIRRAVLMPYSYQLNGNQVTSRSEQLMLDDDDMFLELIREFDPYVQKVEVLAFQAIRPAIYIKHEKLGVAPLSVFGDAMRRCLLLSTTITQLGHGGVLLLDEFEVGIHTRSLSKVFKWLVSVTSKLGIQVFATTHSLEALDALLNAEDGPDNIAAYRIRQGKDGTEHKRFSEEDLVRLRFERGLDVRL